MKLSHSGVETKMGRCVTFSLYLRPHRDTTLKCGIRERDFLTHLTQWWFYAQKLCHLFFGMLTQRALVSTVSPFLQQEKKTGEKLCQLCHLFYNKVLFLAEKY